MAGIAFFKEDSTPFDDLTNQLWGDHVPGVGDVIALGRGKTTYTVKSVVWFVDTSVVRVELVVVPGGSIFKSPARSAQTMD